MVVDDEAGNLRTLNRYLKDLYEVVTFDCPKKALEALNSPGDKPGYSLVISDHIMPHMTGIEFLTLLEKRQYPAVRVLLTGYAALENVIAAINSADVFRFATKPIDGDAVRQLAREAIQMYEIREENQSLVNLVKELMGAQASMSKELADLGHNDMIPALRQKAPTFTAPRRLSVAVLFAEVRGFTEFLTQEPAETVLTVLQQVFQPMHQVIYEHGGIVDKHVGHGVMAVFGLGGDNLNTQVLEACSALVKEVASTISALPDPFNQIKVSLGLASGDVVVGTLGSLSRSELAVIGQPANFAARLQDFSKLALSDTENHPLGGFDKVMALIDHRILNDADSNVIETVTLPKEYRLRDFPNEELLGVIRG